MIEQPAAAAIALPIAVYLLAKGAEWVVLSSARIARRFGLSDHVIGLTVVALGTSAPEFVVTVMAALQGHAAISIGNVVGSNIFNTGLVLGVCVFLWRVPTSVFFSSHGSHLPCGQSDLASIRRRPHSAACSSAFLACPNAASCSALISVASSRRRLPRPRW